MTMYTHCQLHAKQLSATPLITVKMHQAFVCTLHTRDVALHEWHNENLSAINQQQRQAVPAARPIPPMPFHICAHHETPADIS